MFLDTFFMMLKKTMVAMLFVIFGLAATYIPQQIIDETPVAEAGAGVVIDPTNLVQNIVTAVQTTATYVVQNWIYIKESILDGIVWTIAKQFISTMVGNLVDWINTGFNGSPAFVQDLDRFLLQAADQAFDTYLQQLGGVGSFVCDPFRINVQIAVAQEYDIERVINQPVASCDPGRITNLNSFLSGNFNSGGWDDWFDMVREPEIYTPYGAILAAQTGAQDITSQAKRTEQSLLDFGGGFLSGEICQIVTGASGSQQECSISKPGKILQEALSKGLGAGQDTLVQADEFDEIIVALLGQLSNTAITGSAGLLGLTGGTGYTSYSRGSFSAQLQGNSSNVAGGINTGTAGTPGSSAGSITTTSSGAANSYIVTSLTDQQNILSSVSQYITNLQSFIANPLNGSIEVSLAQNALRDANNIRTSVNSGISAVTPLVTEYSTLEAEYPTATLQRQSAIRARQITIVQLFSAVGLYSSSQYSVYTSSWDSILSRNVSFNGNGLNPIIITP